MDCGFEPQPSPVATVVAAFKALNAREDKLSDAELKLLFEASVIINRHGFDGQEDASMKLAELLSDKGIEFFRPDDVKKVAELRAQKAAEAKGSKVASEEVQIGE